MTDNPRETDQPRFWSQSAPSARWQRENESALHRFLGGSPLSVILRLALISFGVGALLMWLRISPAEVFAELSALFDQIWTFGFRSLHDFGNYLFAGAAIVVPVWLLIRLLSYRGR